MDSSQTPPPSGSPAPPPPRALEDDRAGIGPRIGTLVLAVILAIIAAVAIIVMVDVGDQGTCGEIDASTIRGTYECYDFSESIKPVVLAAGWIGAALATVAALLSVAFTIRGRGGRVLLMTTAAATAFLAISIVAAQLS